MFSKNLERPPQMKDDVLWDLLTKLLAFDRKDRISAAEALNHEFFTGE
jgi:serine/threonine protein kinase